jgi:hypothetical protein
VVLLVALEERKARRRIGLGRCILATVRGRESALNTPAFVSANSLMRQSRRAAPQRRDMLGMRRHSKYPDDGEGNRLTQLDPRFPSGWL